MGLYHFRFSTLFLLAFILVAACSPVQAPQVNLQVVVQTASDNYSIEVPQGTTVEQAIAAAGLELGELDRTDPPLFTLLTDEAQVRVTRVREEFDIEQVTIPYESQTLRNEALPDGERRLVQAGVNGTQEITYRRLFEDDEEISRNPVKTVIVKEPVPEIVMLGSQSPFAAVTLPGQIAYLADGNAWLLDGETGERTPVITTGDLDGRVFALSPDGEWLLFTRKSAEENQINSLWVARLDDSELLVDLEAQNIVHYAEWVPNAVLQVAYSTVEPRSTAPGWQANNDLILVSFSPTGWISDPELLVESNAGGVYGWWGTSFAWAPDGQQLAFVRPDGAGLVNLEDGSLQKVYDVTPLQTFGDWAWVPGLSWSPDSTTLFTVDHAAQGNSAADESSQIFDVTAVPLAQGAPVSLVTQAGMFAYPSPSPSRELPGGENAYGVAYLQAVFPLQSETSSYQLVVMDRDGSNRSVLFPDAGAPGMEPQQVVWAPRLDQDPQAFDLAFIYQGNLWLADFDSGTSRQLTGDGLISRLDWK
jgi:resuscitation-promoting factor RpfB